MHVVHPALSTHSFVSNYFPQLPNKSFDLSHDGKTHQFVTSYMGASRLSHEFLCAMGAAEQFEEGTLESKIKLAHTSSHGSLVALALSTSLNQAEMLLAGDMEGMLSQPLESFVMMHKSHKEIFDFFIRQLGCELTDSWKVYNCISSSFSKQLLENNIYDSESEISKKINYAVQYSKFLSNQFGRVKISEEVLGVLSRLSVLGDFNHSPAMRKLADAHIAQTEEMLCEIFSQQLELLNPDKDTGMHSYKKAPAGLEAVYLKPRHFINKKAAAELGISFRRDADYFRFFDSSRVLFSRQIESELPLVSPHIAIYCIQNAADKVCFIADAKNYLKYGMKAASLLMSMGRFAATWIP